MNIFLEFQIFTLIFEEDVQNFTDTRLCQAT